MLPMQVLYGAIGSAVSIELKSGECYNGYIQYADYYMNFKLYDVTITEAEGDKFFHIDECFVRGNNVKYVRVSEEAVTKAENIRLEAKRGRGAPRGRIRGSRRS
ncbi:hypothetical protein SteCoe_14466 [Stentor coeruleus]|uniref:U6 snRNA-associated Sm-like protein LSm4 n=1 Tax=Stentor coeruleus TaxID=5963 RepID=A0A1R2C5T8_9CILI|nr:hypothetical protein SteCoe_14466 [Stentor coeruleus]